MRGPSTGPGWPSRAPGPARQTEHGVQHPGACGGGADGAADDAPHAERPRALTPPRPRRVGAPADRLGVGPDAGGARDRPAHPLAGERLHIPRGVADEEHPPARRGAASGQVAHAPKAHGARRDRAQAGLRQEAVDRAGGPVPAHQPGCDRGGEGPASAGERRRPHTRRPADHGDRVGPGVRRRGVERGAQADGAVLLDRPSELGAPGEGGASQTIGDDDGAGGARDPLGAGLQLNRLGVEELRLDAVEEAHAAFDAGLGEGVVEAAPLDGDIRLEGQRQGRAPGDQAERGDRGRAASRSDSPSPASVRAATPAGARHPPHTFGRGKAARSTRSVRRPRAAIDAAATQPAGPAPDDQRVPTARLDAAQGRRHARSIRHGQRGRAVAPVQAGSLGQGEGLLRGVRGAHGLHRVGVHHARAGDQP